MEELPNDKEAVEETIEKVTIEQPKSIAFMKAKWASFQNLTAKDASDNLWLIGFKFFLKGIMVLILILMSPFILFIITVSLLVAV
jgi:hypothetical protein